jgi:GT2 family glycosyltransferase
MKIDVVILSFCRDVGFFTLTQNCIESLLNSESNFEFIITIVESNANWNTMGFEYKFPNVKVMVPEEDFNFNRFLNIGIKAGNSDLVILANNDLIFHKNWLTEIVSIKDRQSEIKSLCPFDRNSIYLKWEKFKSHKYIIGYQVPIHFVGWCVAIERSVLERVGYLDEMFDLYFQDNDFARTLKKHKVLHALATHSFVEHLGGKTTGIIDASKTEKYQADKNRFESKWGISDNTNRPIKLIKSLLRKFVLK